MKMRISKKRLQNIIKEEYALYEKNKKKLNESESDEIDDMFNRPASRREHLGDAIAHVLEGALRSYLSEMKLEPRTFKRIMLDVEEDILNVAIIASKLIGRSKGFASQEMDESEISEETLAQAVREALAEEGLGDGLKLGGNYSTGYGNGSESPLQTSVGNKKK